MESKALVEDVKMTWNECQFPFLAQVAVHIGNEGVIGREVKQLSDGFVDVARVAKHPANSTGDCLSSDVAISASTELVIAGG